MKNKKFSCDKCHEKLSYKELFKLNKNSTTTCKSCNARLYPVRTISFNWAFFIGFVSTVVPAEIILNTSNNLTHAFIVALTGGVLAISGIALYTYNSTEFKS